LADLVSTYYQSPVGLLRISGNDDFISEVSFREKPDVDGPVELPPLLIDCTEQLIQYFNGQRKVFELPLNQPGSSFQQDTWSILMTIPFGKTISYMQQSIKIGDPKAIRAVASANGRNNIAIIVPCHRVIGTNRDLTGYAGGLWRKRWLLEHETKITHGVLSLFD
jgi:methylated-DNA-[protein]-cysteine S-methyltransferase